MDKLEINAPDGEILEVDLPEGTTPDQYDSIVDDVLKDYEMSGIETGTLEAGARGAMSGIPGATTVVSGLQALGDKTYEQTRRANELESDKAWEEHPVAYGTGKGVGIVGSSLVGGAAASIPKAIATGAAMGGLSGLDASKKIEDMPLDAVKGAVLGGGIGGAAKGLVEPAIGAVVNKVAPAVGKGALAAIGKPTRAQIDDYLQNPESIRQAINRPQIAEKVAESVTDLRTASGHLSEAARSTLDPEHMLMSRQGGISDFKAVIDGIKQQYMRNGAVKTGMEPAMNALDDELARMNSMAKDGMLSEVDLRGMIDDIQDAISEKAFGNPDVSAKQEALRTLSGRLNDMLRRGNEPYTAAMAPSAEAASLSSRLGDTFGVEKGKATDKTVRQVGSLLNEPKIEEQQLISELKDMNGPDIAELLKKANTREAFETPGFGGAMKTLFSTLGFGAGKVTGIPGAGIIGAGVGRFGGEGAHGGNIAKKILDAYIDKSRSWQNSAIRPSLEKYGKILADSAKLGGNQLAATHFVLGTSDPEYQQLEDELSRE